ncbi:hypothetical protein [Aquimarina sp. 2304DJ70-9]|uniref:hypothetical protein n=1 Tax=Aquimarina penaris TaxID=3231044 RepID=UPI003461DDF8
MSDEYNITLVDDLILEVTQSSLYPQLLTQLQKDIDRAGIDYKIDPEIQPKDLITTINKLLLSVLQHTFNEYLNLLYAVDVSEAEIRNFKSEKAEDIAGYATYLILKREWKKVWYRNQLRKL